LHLKISRKNEGLYCRKPSVAREIASVLGANTKHDGYYEGNGYAVTYTFGHLCTLKEPNDYKSYWKSWDLNNLPMLPDNETKVGRFRYSKAI
jgi:DNA topoisomerase-3